MSAPDLRIVVAQLNLLVGDIEGNVDRILDAVNRSRDQHQADMVIFPELALTGYPPEDLLLRPGMYERIEKAMQRLVEHVSGVTAIVGFPHQTGQGVYNAAAVIADKKIHTIAHKHNLPNYSVFDEKRYFIPDEAPCVIEINNIKVGILICEDIWYAEPFKSVVDAGAGLVVNLNASPFHVNKGEEREAIVQQRVAEHSLPVIYTNLVGGQDELVFDGDSFVINAQGQITQRMPLFEEGLFPVDFVNGVPQLQAQMPDRPSLEACVYQALVTGVRDFVQEVLTHQHLIFLSLLLC